LIERNISHLKNIIRNLKSIQNIETVSTAEQVLSRIKHMRGRHDQRTHNRYPKGYISQAELPSSNRRRNNVQLARNSTSIASPYGETTSRQNKIQTFSTNVSSDINAQIKVGPSGVSQVALDYLQKALTPNTIGMSEDFIAFFDEIQSTSYDELFLSASEGGKPSALFTTAIRNAILHLQDAKMRGEQDKPSGDAPISTYEYQFTAEDEMALETFRKLDSMFGISTWTVKDSDITEKLGKEIKKGQDQYNELAVKIIGVTDGLIQTEQEIKQIEDMIENIDSIIYSVSEAIDAVKTKKQKKELEDTIEICKAYQEHLQGYISDAAYAFEMGAFSSDGIQSWYAELLEARHGQYAEKISTEAMKFLSKYFGKKNNIDMQIETPEINFSDISSEEYSYDDGYGDYSDEGFDDSPRGVEQSGNSALNASRKEAIKFLKNFVDGRLHPINTQITYTDEETSLGFETPSYDVNTNSVTLNQYGSSFGILIHELMHAIQENKNIASPDADRLRTLIKGFFINRLKNNPTISQSGDITWAKDDFPDWYAGLMKQKNPQELLSMGISMLLVNPVRFAKEQPDYFRFLSILLSGNWIGRV